MNTAITREQMEHSLPAYVLIVHTQADKLTRRPYLSLEAAVKATKRAEARGQTAHLELVRVSPYWPKTN